MQNCKSITGSPRARIAVLALVVVCLISGCSPAMGKKETPDPRNRPNVIFILTDDLDTRSISHMPNLRSLLIEEGTTFENAFVTDSLCCPSRATMLRGQYAHNHGILGNEPPQGGSRKFHELGLEGSTAATWLQKADYRTVFVGKYLNGYGFGEFDHEYVPPGWDQWYGIAGNYLSSRVNENGDIRSYDPRTHNSTDVLSDRVTGYIRRAVGEDAPPLSTDEPFFMWIGTMAPHEPAVSPHRYRDAFADTRLPRPASFDERDISDKPGWLRDNPPLGQKKISQMTGLYRNRLRSMLGVDDMIGRLVRELREAGEMDNTYIFFTSDNGYHMGEHRLGQGKWTAYEEDIRVPLIVRGPGVPAGRRLDLMVLNNDLAPTFADLAGAEAPSFVDGRSLAPLLTEDPPSQQVWRKAFLVEGASDSVPDPKARWSPLTGDRAPEDTPRDWGRPGFEAVRMKDHLYVEYETGERELYDLREDPDELNNAYPEADPRLLENLKVRLDILSECYGNFCKTAENGGEGEYSGRGTPEGAPRVSSQPGGRKTTGKRR